MIVSKAIPANEFEKLINTWEYILIDIRTPQELEHFWTIKWVDYTLDFYNENDMKKLLQMDKNKKYLIYCYHWNRTRVLRNFMIENWFKHVIDLEWGTDAWLQNGKELVDFNQK